MDARRFNNTKFFLFSRCAVGVIAVSLALMVTPYHAVSGKGSGGSGGVTTSGENGHKSTASAGSTQKGNANNQQSGKNNSVRSGISGKSQPSSVSGSPSSTSSGKSVSGSVSNSTGKSTDGKSSQGNKSGKGSRGSAKGGSGKSNSSGSGKSSGKSSSQGGSSVSGGKSSASSNAAGSSGNAGRSGSGSSGKGSGKGASNNGKDNDSWNGGRYSAAGKVSTTKDDDSDRPDWAMGNHELNPHSGTGNPSPGDMKGDEYGDLYVVLRDPVTGEPILDGDELQLCLDADCTEVESTVDGEVPQGVTPIEVEFERLNLGRAPDKVIEHALDEAMSKITEAEVLALDYAGRIMVDAVTIDSPLENLALYLAIMCEDQTVIKALSSLGEPLDLAAALLGGAASKTGEITVDILYYSNQIYDLAQPGTFYDYTEFTYDRSTIYNEDVNYFYMDGDEVESATVNLQAYLDATQPEITNASGITLFSIAADDALEIVELLHTLIHDDLLPGTL